MARKGLLDLRIARADSDELESLSITSRDVVQLERRVKGVTMSSFLKDLSLVNCYHAAFLAMRREARISDTMTLAEFEAAFDLDLRDPDEGNESSDDDETANPTSEDL